jgi:glycerophosphoryl diester phosphodiesterase
VNRPEVVAHRGSSATHAENSWAAFEAAVAAGADAIECDVQGTRDGVLLIRHELVLGQRSIAECSAAEVDALEPGLVRLADLLDWAPRSDIGLLIELKDPEIALRVGGLVATSLWRERITIGGFHGPALAALKERTPDVRTSLMVGTVVAPADLVRLAQAYRANGVHPCWEHRAPTPHRLLDAAAVARVREAGLTLTLWHEERESELQALVALGPDAICTDEPALLRRIVDRFGRATGEEAPGAQGSSTARPGRVSQETS